MTKKTYIAPTLEAVDFKLENMLAVSSDEDTFNGDELSNKRQQPTVSSWSSSNWNTEEEF